MTDLTLEDIVEELSRRQKHGGWIERYFNTATTRKEYPKHWEFFDAGADHRFRLFTAGNRVGKSLAAGCELVMHLTGDYHPDWKGRRFDGPVNVWIVGRSSELVRQTLQPLLLGDVGDFGTGLIPQDRIDFNSLTDAKKASTPISQFRVLHNNGGYSTVAFKSGEQGREAFQAAALDICWLDEEIPFDVFNECLVRLMTRNGILMYSFTPLKGLTETVKTFIVNGDFKEGSIGNNRYVVRCSMYEAKHLKPEVIEDLIASTPPFQRDARIYGIPALGSGAIYPVPESEFVEEPFPIPKHWPRLYGMDVGNKTAAVWLAKNPDTNIWYATDEYYKEREEPSIHASAISLRGKWIPGAIDPASRGRSQIDGKQLMKMYEDLGLNLNPAVNAVEAGLYTVWELLSTGGLKIFRTCQRLREEMRTYRRDEKGNVVKENDHLCFHGDTLIWTEDGKKPIKDLVGTQGRLLSIAGFEDYEDVRLIKKSAEVVEVVFADGTVTCTPDHQFLTTCGWVEAKDLTGYNVVCPNTEEYQWTLKSSALPSSASTASSITTTANTTPTNGRIGVGFISGFGKILTVLSQKVGTFITSMKTGLTTACATLNVCRPLTTPAGIQISHPSHEKLSSPPPKKSAHLRDGHGHERQQKLLPSPQGSGTKSNSPVFSVETSLGRYEAHQECATRSVENGGLQVCLEVRPIDVRADVFCLTVPTNGALTVGPGVIAHNCDAMRYAVMTRDISTVEKPVNTAPLSSVYVSPIRM